MRGRRGRRWTGTLLVVAVLGMGAAVTAGAYDVVEHGEDRYAGQVMDRYADDLSAAVTDRAGRYGETVTDLAAAVGAQSDLRGDDFTRITATLDAVRLPGAASIDFIVPATTAQVPALQRHWRGQGDRGLTLKPAPGQDMHEFVIFEHPFDGVDIAGADLAQRPAASEAVRIARQSGRLAISPAFQLIRDDNLEAAQRQTSVTFAGPVYSGLGSDAPDVFQGWIVMPVRGQDFLGQTLLDRGQGAVQVRVADGASALATVGPGRRVPDDSLTRQRVVTVGQRHWDVSLWPTTQLLRATDRGLSRFTMAAGIALTLLLGLMTGMLTGSRNRALQRVDEATAQLRDDISRREQVEATLRERERELQDLAFRDALTGLANRRLFHDRLTQALAGHIRSGHRLAVLFVDLDGFKAVNDRLGHHAGDIVLRTIADRLRTGLRASDTVARFGGDEFAVILEGVSVPDDVRTAAERVIAEVRAPIDIAGGPARVSASIGIALSGSGATADDLMREADSAMYAAKNAGKDRYVAAF
ncbi:diguanylate cyclase [Actinoplanes bogorensis]|uniref:Diguanylate cyclase n=1 Tax=Paractinoplanes bogorensis TaxID=1610840 RepID=A0ABS5YN13_9ACTN|nr:diguanylate cyclase [Actinoplanes bogorensis]MBU2664763.1 diguanylate cyclase [Actinoplanes bogorensis]